MALEGHSSQAIAEKLGMPKRTVNHWLQEARQEWIAKAAQGSAELFATDLARIDTLFREAMQAWRKSQTDKVVRIVEHTESADGEATTKTSIRTQTQCGTAAYLTRAMAAAMASWRLRGKPGPLSAEAIAPKARRQAPAATPAPATNPTEDESHIPEAETAEAEAVETEKARLEFLEKEDLEGMTHEETPRRRGRIEVRRRSGGRDRSGRSRGPGCGAHERRAASRLPCSAVCGNRGRRRIGRIPGKKFEQVRAKIPRWWCRGFAARTKFEQVRAKIPRRWC